MNFIELKTYLQNLINIDITQSKIGDILGTSRANISKKFRNPNSQVSVAELKKIEEFFGVNIYKSTFYSLKRQYDESIQNRLESIGDRLAAIQEENNYVDSKMAALLDVTEDYYLDIKNGKKKPDTEFLIAIKQNFKVSIDWLMFGE